MEGLTVQVFLPERSEDSLSEALRELTRALEETGADPVRGVFGGEHGYGATYSDDVFAMHPFCWCEKRDCAWCAGCWCDSNCRSDYGRGMPAEGEPYPPDEKCPWCRDVNQWPEKGSLAPDIHPHQGAPHFWHKPSGLRVWWYKYIGRDMEVHAPDGIDPTAIVLGCIARVRGEAN